MNLKLVLAAGVSAILLAIVYLTIDVGDLVAALARTDLTRLFISIAVLLAVMGLSAVRLGWLARTVGVNIGHALAMRATFAANALNLFMPGKLGDLAKASMLRKAGHGSLLPGLNISIYEKLGDVMAVLVCGGVALVFVNGSKSLEAMLVGGAGGLLLWAMLSPVPARISLALAVLLPGFAENPLKRLGTDWIAMISTFRRRPAMLLLTLGLTMVIWLGHFVQISLMAWALGVEGPWLPLVATFPVIILSGLVPVTIAGIGPRDAAMVMLAGPLIGNGTAAALGVLFLLRYLIPGIIGLPIIPEYGQSLHQRSE